MGCVLQPYVQMVECRIPTGLEEAGLPIHGMIAAWQHRAISIQTFATSTRMIFTWSGCIPRERNRWKKSYLRGLNYLNWRVNSCVREFARSILERVMNGLKN
jgi:hypothetical protein